MYNLLNCGICETITTSNSINIAFTSKTFLLLYNFLPLSHSSAGKGSTCNAGDPSSIPGSGRSPGKGRGHPLQYSWASLVVQLVKDPPPTQETCVLSLDWEDTLEKGTATHSSILAWRIPWTVYPMGSQKAGHNWATFTFTFHIWGSVFSWVTEGLTKSTGGKREGWEELAPGELATTFDNWLKKSSRCV